MTEIICGNCQVTIATEAKREKPIVVSICDVCRSSLAGELIRRVPLSRSLEKNGRPILQGGFSAFTRKPNR